MSALKEARCFLSAVFNDITEKLNERKNWAREKDKDLPKTWV